MWSFISGVKNGVDAQILAAQSAIESYAKQKNVTIEMARRMNITRGANPTLKDEIAISVYNPKTKAQAFEFVPVMGENETVTAVKRSSKVFTNADGVEVVEPIQSEYEDTFMRHLYRRIEQAVKNSSM